LIKIRSCSVVVSTENGLNILKPFANNGDVSICVKKGVNPIKQYTSCVPCKIKIHS
jgi:hypothetical protein